MITVGVYLIAAGLVGWLKSPYRSRSGGFGLLTVAFGLGLVVASFIIREV